MNNPSEQRTDLAEAFESSERTIRMHYSKIGCVLTMILVPGGIALDNFVYPLFLKEFLFGRILTVVAVAIILRFHWSDWGKKHVRGLSLLNPVLVKILIIWMIFRTEGAGSPYYGGVTLIMLAAGVLYTLSFVEAALLALFSLASYLLACGLNQSEAVQMSIWFNNLFFLILTDIIVISGAFFKARNRFADFCLRHLEIGEQVAQLEQSNQKLSELDRYRSDFFGDVSHELRTPLTLIISPIEEVLRSEPDLDDETNSRLNLAHRNSLRLLKLINDLLELNRIDAQDKHFVSEDINFSEFVLRVAESLRYLANLRSLVMRTNVAPDLWIRGDTVDLEKIVINLITNAIKYTLGGGQISITVKKGVESVIFEVVDTGIGIPDEDIPHIFERYRQVERGRAWKKRGLGIGLALVQELVSRHGGQISATSKEGAGTKMKVEFPWVRHHSQGNSTTKSIQSYGSDTVDRITQRADREGDLPYVPEKNLDTSVVKSGKIKGTILVVDDEPEMRQFVVSLLRGRFNVLEAESGERGLELFHEHSPSLVVVDLMMPGINGDELCRRILEKCEHPVKILMLTARTEESIKINALEQGVDDFLTKPFSGVEVQSRVANMWRTAQLESSLRQKNSDLEIALTRLKEAETQLVQNEKMRALGQLAAGLLHEINNPLNFSLVAISLAKSEIQSEAQSTTQPDSEMAEILDDIETGMKRIRDIISDLRGFANPAAHKRHVEFDMSSAVQKALRLVGHELTGVRVAQNIPDECLVLGSETQVIQVLVNLLVNACIAIRDKPEIASNQKEDAASQIVIQAKIQGERLHTVVRDRGVGISEDKIVNVLNPFYTTREVGGGMGLGLSICHRIVQDHGGEIRIRSELNSWTEIEFDLPLATKESPNA